MRQSMNKSIVVNNTNVFKTRIIIEEKNTQGSAQLLEIMRINN